MNYRKRNILPLQMVEMEQFFFLFFLLTYSILNSAKPPIITIMLIIKS